MEMDLDHMDCLLVHLKIGNGHMETKKKNCMSGSYLAAPVALYIYFVTRRASFNQNLNNFSTVEIFLTDFLKKCLENSRNFVSVLDSENKKFP